MSDFQQAALISGGIMAATFASQIGRRDLSWHKIVYPMLAVLGFGYAYLKDAPTSRPELWVYAAAAGLGLIFAAITTATTAMVRDGETGHVMTICGAGFVATWLVAVGARLTFVYAVEHDMAFRNQVGQFMVEHRIHETAIAPFFVIWALTMVMGRIASILVRAGRLPAVAPAVAPALAPAAAAVSVAA